MSLTRGRLAKVEGPNLPIVPSVKENPWNPLIGADSMD